jgi:soluble lytic murein transglycosylase-like protein
MNFFEFLEMAGNASQSKEYKIKDIFNPEDSKLYDPESIALIDSLTNEFAMGNTPELYKYIGDLESNNNPAAESSISKAKGIYQFTPDAVESTKRSAKRNVGYNSAFIDSIPDNPTKWSPYQANVMLTSYLFPKEMEGKPSGFIDELLKRSFKQDYDIEDWEEVYKLHHTNIDKTQYLDEINRNLQRISPLYTR